MKKTIAKIMAAAMVLSTIPAVALPSLTADAGYIANSEKATISALNINQGSTQVGSLTETGKNVNGTAKTALEVSNNDKTVEDGKITKLTTNLAVSAKVLASVSNTVGYGQAYTAASELTGVTTSNTGLTGANKPAATYDLDANALSASTNGKNNAGILGLSIMEKVSPSDVSVFSSVYVNSDGYIEFKVNESNGAQDALNNASTTPVTVGLRLSKGDGVAAVAYQASGSSDWTAYTNDKLAWGSSEDGWLLYVKITGTDTTSSSGSTNSAVKTANGTVIPLSLELNTSGLTATITAADPNKTGKDASGVATEIYKTDLVKGQTIDLTQVTVDGKVYKITKINARVFKEAKFKKVIAKNVKHINQGAFRKCKQLTTVNLGTDKAIRKIHSKAFYNDKKLSTIKLDGRNLKAVGSQAFQGVKKNCAIKVKGSKTKFNKAAKLIKKGVKTTKIKVSRIS